MQPTKMSEVREDKTLKIKKSVLCVALILALLFTVSQKGCFGATVSTPNEEQDISDAQETAELLSVGVGQDSGRWPSDHYSSLYNTDNNASVALPSAWLLETVSSVKIGVVDSGIDADHEDFAGNYMGGASFVDS